jgi:hypothetical protein
MSWSPFGRVGRDRAKQRLQEKPTFKEISQSDANLHQDGCNPMTPRLHNFLTEREYGFTIGNFR